MAPTIWRPDPNLRSKYYLYVLFAAVPSLLFLGLMVAAIGYDIGGTDGLVRGVAIALLANALWILPALLIVDPYYRSLRYEIHEEEVIVRLGIITKSVKHVPFRTMTNIQISRGPLGRLYGLGTLKIQTAGYGAANAPEQSLQGLDNHQQVYEQVAAALHGFRSALPPTQGQEAPAVSEADGAALLAEVRAIRELLEQRGAWGG